MPVRIVFFGNSLSTFSAKFFSALLQELCDLVAVVDVPPSLQATTNPLAPGLVNFSATARERQIPCFQPSNPNTQPFAMQLAVLKADLFVAAGYPVILKESLLSLPTMLPVNFHASLLPEYRGKHPVFWALRDRERWSGMTLHVIDPGIDTSDIIYQVKIRTRRSDSVATLYERIIQNSLHLVGRLIADAERGRIPHQPQPQDSGSYYSSTSEEDFHLDWKWPAEKMARFITITPGKCFQLIRGKKVYFSNAKQEPGQTPSTPGTLLKVRNEYASVATGLGIFSSSAVRTDAGEPVSFALFCRQEGLAPGDNLCG